MDKTFSALKEKYTAFQSQQEELEEREKRDKAKTLLGEIRKAGQMVYKPEHRYLLSNFARELGDLVYKIRNGD